MYMHVHTYMYGTYVCIIDIHPLTVTQNLTYSYEIRLIPVYYSICQGHFYFYRRYRNTILTHNDQTGT